MVQPKHAHAHYIMMYYFAESKEDTSSSTSLVPIIVILIVVMALLAIVMTIVSIGIVYYKKRKQQRTGVREEFEIPQYAEILSDFKERNTPQISEHYYEVVKEYVNVDSSSQLPPMKMGRNVAYGVGLAQTSGWTGSDLPTMTPTPFFFSFLLFLLCFALLCVAFLSILTRKKKKKNGRASRSGKALQSFTELCTLHTLDGPDLLR